MGDRGRGNRLLVGLGLRVTRTAIVPTGYLEVVNRKGGWQRGVCTTLLEMVRTDRVLRPPQSR
jgi:hypothetical protein